jgi:hypothetical protein
MSIFDFNLPVWAIYLLVGCSLLVIVLGILQVLWIRGRIRSLEDDSYQKEAMIRHDVNENAFVTNRLQVYGLVVDGDATSLLNNTTLKVFYDIAPYAVPRKFNLTHVCSDGVKSLNVDVKKVGFLVCLSNDGAENLRNDVISQRVQYIVIQNQQFLIGYEQDQSNKDVLDYLKGTGLDPLSNIEDRVIFYVYGTRSIYNTFSDENRSASDSCAINIKSFYGVTYLTDDATQAINMKEVLGIGSEKELPVHVLGYKIM